MNHVSAIITPTLNNEDYTIRCFDSIRKNTNNYIIIWIDNGSSPESREKVKKFLDENNVPYELIFNQENLGFVKATNQGMRKAMELNAKYIILQNNDTEVYDGWLDRMIEVAEADPRIGLVGPITSPCNSWQSIEHIKKNIKGFEDLPEYRNNPKEYSQLIREQYKNQSVETGIQLAFFSALVKREVIDRIGFLSEDFGIGFGDDDDFCFRARKGNWKIMIAKDVFVFHNHRATFRSLYAEDEIKSMQKMNLAIFRKKHKHYLMNHKKIEISFRDQFVKNYFEKDDVVLDCDKKNEKQHKNIGLFIKENKDKKRILLLFSHSCGNSKDISNLDNITRIARLENYDLFVINEEDKEIYKITPNEKEWIPELINFKCLNLLLVKREVSLFLCFISHSFKQGGSERSLVDMIDGLIKRKVICHVYIPATGELESRIKKKPISYSISSCPWWVKSISTNIPEKKATEMVKKSTELIERQMAIINPDVVYTNSSVVNIGAIVAKKLGIFHIWHIREFGSRKHRLDFYQGFEKAAKFIYDNSDKIIFNSFAVKKHYESIIPSDKSEVLYNYIDEKKLIILDTKKINYFKNKENLKMIMLGEVARGKGQKDAILAVKKIVEKGINKIELLIVGGVDPVYHKELADIIKKNHLENYVKFLGYIDEPVQALYESDLMLMCSQDEAFGRVTAEAILMKKPVIGANSGGTPELVKDGFNGFLYEPENAEELADKIKYFLDNREKMKEFGLSGYKLVTDKFNEKQYSGRVFEIIRELKNREKEKRTQISSEDIKKFLILRKNKQFQFFGLIWKKYLRMKDLFKKAFNILFEGGPLTLLSYMWKFVKYGRNYFR